MNKQSIVRNACAIVATLFVSAGLSSASGQTLIYKDTFPGTAQNLDGAPTTGISGLDGGASGALPQSQVVENNIDGAGNVIIEGPSGANGAIVRFDTIGSASTLYDWAASPGGSAITAAGGMTVSFNWLANDTVSGNWLAFEVGSDPNDIFGHGVPMVNHSTVGNGILLSNNGQIQTFSSGVSGPTGSFSVGASPVTEAVVLTYDFTSWAAGTAGTLSATVNGVPVITNDAFTWNVAESGSNFLNLESWGETNAVSDFQVNTNISQIPEPGAYGMALLGLGVPLVWRRIRARRSLI